MDEGEYHHADSFNLDHYVAVAVDAFYETFVAFIQAADDSHLFAGGEDGGVVDATFGGVVGCQEFQKVNGPLRDYLDIWIFGVAEYPELQGVGVGLPAETLEPEGVVFRGLDEEDMGNDGPFSDLALGEPCDIDWEKDLLAEGRQRLLGLEILQGLDGVPPGVALLRLVHVLILFFLLRGAVV